MNKTKNHDQLLRDRGKLIELIYRLLEDILKATADMPKGSSKFHAKTIPNSPVYDYLQRLSRYCHCSGSAYVIALIYIDRLQEVLEDFVINKYCIHKILITSLVLAAKYNDDEYYKNAYYARVGGISLQEMNTLEFHFTTILDYNLFVKPDEFRNYLDKLITYDVVNESQ